MESKGSHQLGAHGGQISSGTGAQAQGATGKSWRKSKEDQFQRHRLKNSKVSSEGTAEGSCRT